MKKKKIIIYAILIIIINILSFISIYNKKEFYITDYEYLYDEAVDYLTKNDTNPEKDKERYKMFIDYEGFGITENKKYRYVYMWINEETYYVDDNKIISSSGSSMAYRFTFNINDKKIVSYDIPKDGNEYTASIKKMFPKDIANKVLKYQYNNDKIEELVHEYYADLEDQNIYNLINDEYVKIGTLE